MRLFGRHKELNDATSVACERASLGRLVVVRPCNLIIGENNRPNEKLRPELSWAQIAARWQHMLSALSTGCPEDSPSTQVRLELARSALSTRSTLSTLGQLQPKALGPPFEWAARPTTPTRWPPINQTAALGPLVTPRGARQLCIGPTEPKWMGLIKEAQHLANWSHWRLRLAVTCKVVCKFYLHHF